MSNILGTDTHGIEEVEKMGHNNSNRNCSLNFLDLLP